MFGTEGESACVDFNLCDTTNFFIPIIRTWGQKNHLTFEEVRQAHGFHSPKEKKNGQKTFGLAGSSIPLANSILYTPTHS